MRETLFLLVICLLPSLIFCEVKLPRLISDGMILQRDTTTKIWGWADPGESIQLQFKDQHYSTTANNDGRWQILLTPQPAGGPYSMIIRGTNTITINNILFGEVWVCSGQSNMEFVMETVKEKYADIISNSTNPFIRQFEAPDSYDFKGPRGDFKSGNWISADTQSILQFSAVAYFFARSLYERYKTPIGIINNAVGGSPAESWISEKSITAFPHYHQELIKYKDTQLVARIDSTNWANIRNWNAFVNNNDTGLLNNWHFRPKEYESWENFTVPGYWADGSLGEINGVLWFAKKINISHYNPTTSYTVQLGHLVDADSTFINGKFIGYTPFRFGPRNYKIPSDILQEGENIIVVRLINQSGKGGFIPDKPYRLIGNNDTIDLTGTWKYKIGVQAEPQPPYVFLRWNPVGLFNAMTAPLLNYTVKGVIWYQGESNVHNPSEYQSLMKTLIADWREHWQNEKLPFIYVQLSGYLPIQNNPSESNWAALRQAQLETLTIPATGMVVTSDIGEWNDVHPLNKLDVGERLALQARHIAYHENITHSGPIAVSAKKKGKKIIIQFKHTGSGLVSKHSKELKHFAVGDVSGNFKWAKAVIRGNKVIVRTASIKHPHIVRYAWADNPQNANLYNKEGLPASPFEIHLHLVDK